MRRGHNALRVAALASSPAAALQVAGAWLWPNDDGRGAEYLARRARHAASAVGRALRSPWPRAHAADVPVGAAPSAGRSVDGPDLLDAVRTVVTDAGGGMWIRAYGGSMAPAVPHGARIHLAPLATVGPRRGDVVFAEAPQGALVHRVVATWRDRVLLQGDAMAHSDRPVSRSALLAVVDAVEVAAGVEPIEQRPKPPIWRRLRRSPRQLALVLGLAASARAPRPGA
jgi:hypothetical protein